MQVRSTPADKPLIGVMGHAGAGHVHSHSGFIQDDSAGFAVVTTLIRRALPVDTTVAGISVDGDTVAVRTADGGIGRAKARRGFSHYEQELMQRGLGRDAVISQSCAFRCFGRIYGQGVLEAPVAFQTALCLAVIDTFSRKYPDQVRVAGEGFAGNVGRCLAAHLAVDGIPVAAFALINASAGGIGPVEDLEGNVCFAGKGELMKEFGLHRLPTIIVESKAYVPAVGEELATNSFFIRHNKTYDNPVVAAALIEGAKQCDLPYRSADDAYPRYTGDMRRVTADFAARLKTLAEKIESASSAAGKTALVAELAVLASQDAGGITYMSDPLFDLVAGGGLMPGTAAVLSMVVTKPYIEQRMIPEVDETDIAHYLTIIAGAAGELEKNIHAANACVEKVGAANLTTIDEMLAGG